MIQEPPVLNQEKVSEPSRQVLVTLKDHKETLFSLWLPSSLTLEELRQEAHKQDWKVLGIK